MKTGMLFTPYTLILSVGIFGWISILIVEFFAGKRISAADRVTILAYNSIIVTFLLSFLNDWDLSK